MNDGLHLVTEPVDAEPTASGSPAAFEELVHDEHADLYSALCLITRDRGVVVLRRMRTAAGRGQS
jgi:hypothetical protein